MRNQRVLDEFDLQAEREALALNRFRREIGESIGRVGTPKHKTKKGVGSGKRTNEHHYKGAKTGVWRGLPG